MSKNSNYTNLKNYCTSSGNCKRSNFGNLQSYELFTNNKIVVNPTDQSEEITTPTKPDNIPKSDLQPITTYKPCPTRRLVITAVL